MHLDSLQLYMEPLCSSLSGLSSIRVRIIHCVHATTGHEGTYHQGTFKSGKLTKEATLKAAVWKSDSVITKH